MLAGAATSFTTAAHAAPKVRTPELGTTRHIEAGSLDIGYYELGSRQHPAVILLHGFPYDVHSYVDVAPLLPARAFRCHIYVAMGLSVSAPLPVSDRGNRRRWAMIGWAPRSMCRDGAFFGALPRAGVGQRISGPGYCEGGDPRRQRSNAASGFSFTSRRSAGEPGHPEPTRHRPYHVAGQCLDMDILERRM